MPGTARLGRAARAARLTPALLGLLLVPTLLAGSASADTPPPAPSAPIFSVTGEGDPDAAPADGDIHADPALVAASDALKAAEADLAEARETLATVQAELEAARRAEEKAQVELRAAELAEESAVRALANVRQRLATHREQLGRLAGAAYRANGPLGEWSLVLASETPEQLVDRLAFVQSVSNAGNTMIADLREDRAELTTFRARLAAARMLQERERAAAAEAVQKMAVKEREARLAEQQLSAVVTAHQAALDTALDAKAADQARYQVLTVASGDLAGRIRALAARMAASPRPPQGTGTFVLPGTGAVTSPYGPRLHPILNYVKTHTGLDLGSGDGVVYAADSGVVLLTEANTAYGNMTVVDHGTVGGLRITTLYAHQAAVAVRPGDRVRRGQPIGAVGATGYATGPHLHFEVRVDGGPIAPEPFLEGAALPPAAR